MSRTKIFPRTRVHDRLVGGTDYKFVELDLRSESKINAFLARYNGSYSRASEMNVFDSDGVLQTYGNNELPICGLSQGGLASWPSVTNQLAANKYRDPSNWDVVSCDTSQNETGIDGAANTAWTLEDTNISDAELVWLNITIPDDSNRYSFGIFIKKDSNETRYPYLYTKLDNGTTNPKEAFIFNTRTGEIESVKYSDGENVIYDIGDWWFITFLLENNSTGNTEAVFWISPAYSSDGENLDNSATGSIVVDWVQFCHARRCPIHPVAGGETLAESEFTFKNDGLLYNSDSAVYGDIHFMPEHYLISSMILYSDTATSKIYHLNNFNGIKIDWGAGFTEGPVDTSDRMKFVCRWWNGSNVQVICNGSSGSIDNSYDGDFVDQGDDLYLGVGSIWIMEGIISKITFYPKQPKSQAYWEAKTS